MKRVVLMLAFGVVGTAVAADAPKTLVVPPVPRAEVIDPLKVVRAPQPAKAPAQQLIPNQFPDPATLPTDHAPAPLPPAGAASGDLIHVLDPDGWRTGPAPGAAATSTSSSTSTGKAPSAWPPIDVRMDGGFDNGVAPPDAVMAAGRGHVVSLVNSLIQFQTKTGTIAGGPWRLKDFFGIPDGFGISDPLAMYDALMDRFVVTVMADNGTTQDARLCVAFSQTGDPTQPWNKYFIDADQGQPQNWLDYPSNGVDRFAVYFTGNMFARAGGFSNVTVYIYNKYDGYNGVPLHGLHLIDVRTTGNGAPFRLRPAYVTEIAKNDEFWFAQMDGTSDHINLFRLRGDRFKNPEFTPYSVPAPGIYLGPGKARQPGGTSANGVDTLGGSSWNTWYRNGTLWLTNAIRGSGVSSWIHKIDVVASPPVRVRTWQIDGGTRDIYFPHVIPDPVTDDFIFFSAYSGNDLYVTGRYWNVDGTTGTVRYAEETATGALRNDSGRHGDYFQVNADPLDRNRVWGITQYMQQSTFTGNVRIASARVKDVPAPVAPVPVPDGSVRAARGAGSNVDVTWNAATCSAPNHHIVWFDLAGIKSYPTVAETCGVGSTGAWSGAAPAGNVAFIVVADDGSTAEGSHGRDSLGHERPSVARSCGITQKVWAAVCTP